MELLPPPLPSPLEGEGWVGGLTSEMSTPNSLNAFIVLIVSSALRKFFMILFPFERDEKITAL